MQYQIKDAKPDDLDSLNKLLRLSKAHWGYDEEFLDRFMEKLGINIAYLQKNDIKTFYIENKLAGFYNFVLKKDGLLELDNFFLHPDYIGQGYGRILWDACCKTALALGKKEFIIWSDPNAENFYLKMGCKKIGVRQSPMSPNRFPAVLKYEI